MNQSEVCDDIDNNCDWSGLSWARYLVNVHLVTYSESVACHEFEFFRATI